MYKIVISSQAKKDAKKLKNSPLKKKVTELFEIIVLAPYKMPPEFEILGGDMKGAIARRINRQHRLVYEVYEQEKIIKILRMWTHYE